jgi:molybdopterin/thiamine biosynthesis adenylyltransferase/proteasome lid subunit RPN8/RPN11
MTVLESDLDELIGHLYRSKNEEAASLTARVVTTAEETRLLVRSVKPVADADIESQSPVDIVIRSPAYVHAIKRSRLDASAFVFVHSHPGGPSNFSDQDDREEAPLFALAHGRNEQIVHASLVSSDEGKQIVGRVWRPDGTNAPLDLIRVVGNRWRFLFREENGGTAPEYFDRQVRAFGTDVQRLLSRLHVGIVGAGGTGSAVAEQLIRLGVGCLTIVDHDVFDDTNVNRVYGSSVFDRGIPKVTLTARQAAHIGVCTSVIPIHRHLGFKSAAAALRNCDVVFGCTDDEWGRSVLTRLAIYYVLPVLDMGVLIDPDGETIRSVHGRVTVLQPGYACLYCRERISPAAVTAESIAATQPERAEQLAAEGYIPGVAAPAPAVISFTCAIASAAVAEFLDRLIGYKTAERKSSEYFYRFEADTISRNSRAARGECFCADRALWGVGDRKLFLGVTWRPE